MIEYISILLLLFLIREIIKRKNLEKTQDKLIKDAREDAVKRSRSVIEGQILEKLAPILPGWKYTLSDCKFLSAPIDYVIFDGLSEGKILEVILLEIKKDDSNSTKRQNSIKKAVTEGRVRYELLRIKDV